MTKTWKHLVTLGSRLPGAVKRRVSERIRERAPKTTATNRQAVERGLASWTCVLPRQPVDWGEPERYGEPDVDYRPMLTDAFPEQGLLRVPKGRVAGADAWVFAPDGSLLHEVSWYGTDTEGIRVPRDISVKRTVRGTCLSLCSTWAAKSYGHFVFDALPRAHLVALAGLELNSFDAVVVPTPYPGPATEMTQRLDIDPSRVVWADETLSLQADELVVPSFPGVRRNYPPWAVTWLRTLMGVEVQGRGKRRLYISRRGFTRNASNDDELIAMLRRHGVETYDPMASRRQIADFNEAELVIGPSGSALTNLAFCRPGTIAIELIPTDHIAPYYLTLSRSAGLDYKRVICRSSKERRDPTMWASDADFVAPVGEIDALLTRLLGTRRG